jgi:hypothetical protein
MPFSVRLTDLEEELLEAAARRTSRTKSELVRESVRELCLRLAQGQQSPFDLGHGLFGSGSLAGTPADPVKRAVRERLRAKHQRVG